MFYFRSLLFTEKGMKEDIKKCVQIFKKPLVLLNL